MKKTFLTLIAIAAVSASFGQAMPDAYKYSAPQLRGTARFVSMGGAFGALGGDITTLTQNPAGIGVYRSSEVVATIGLDITGTSASTPSAGKASTSDTRFNFNNFGYIGTVNFGRNTGLVNLNFGVAYNRLKSFNRTTQVKYTNIPTSLSNYAAEMANQERQLNIANGITPLSAADLDFRDDYDPYNADPYIPWLLPLAYQSFLISQGTNEQFFGGYNADMQNANATMYMNERGRIDEYNFNIGGNVSNTFYWGFGFGVTDISYELRSNYKEMYQYAATSPIGTATGHFDLGNTLSTRGSGINFKLGIIARPNDLLRLGVAIHTPTFYSLRDAYDANINFNNIIDNTPGESPDGFKGNIYTPNGTMHYNLSTPWKFMGSAAFFFGKKGLISFDYELNLYNSMRLYDDWGTLTGTDDIKNAMRANSTFRIGGEYRVTSQFSLRAGYALYTSPVRSSILEGDVSVPTAGTVPQYALPFSTNYYNVGFGYRFSSLYIDMAYSYCHENANFFAFSPTAIGSPEIAKLTNSNHSILLTLGLKY